MTRQGHVSQPPVGSSASASRLAALRSLDGETNYYFAPAPCQPGPETRSLIGAGLGDTTSMTKKRSAGATPAARELTRLGIEFTTHAYEHDPAAESYGREAAAVLGVDPGRVFKTLLARVDDAYTVAMVPVLASLDLKALARATNGRRATMMPPGDAERLTGYVVGGISPIGQRRRLTTVLDGSAEAFETVLVSGGRRGFDIELAPEALMSATGASMAPIAR